MLPANIIRDRVDARLPPGRPSRRLKGDGGLHARWRVTRHRQRLTVSSAAAASSFAEWPKLPQRQPLGESSPPQVGPGHARPPRPSGGSRGGRVTPAFPHGGGGGKAAAPPRARPPAPRGGGGQEETADVSAPPSRGQAAACWGVFTFPTAREVMPAPRAIGGVKRRTCHARLPPQGGRQNRGLPARAPPRTSGGSRGDRGHARPPPPPPGGPPPPAAMGGVKWRRGHCPPPPPPPGGQATACRGVFTFPMTSSPRDSTPSARRDTTPGLQQGKQVQPDGGGTAATLLLDRRRIETEQVRPQPRPYGP
jgi:hypothetical protein